MSKKVVKASRGLARSGSTRPGLRFVPATPDLLAAYYGGDPPFGPQDFVALIDSEPVGLGGITSISGISTALYEMKGELRARQRDLARFLCKFEALVEEFEGELFAIASEPTSAGPLKGLGFRDTGIVIESGRLTGPLMARTTMAYCDAAGWFVRPVSREQVQ
jgi:hypothetical protein